MTAAAADRSLVQHNGEVESYPVAASEEIFLGTFVCLDADGYAVAGANTAGYKFVGVSDWSADNSAGADAAINIRVARRGVFKMVASGLALADSGCDLYLADDQTVQKAKSNVYVGKLSKYTAASEAYVLIDDAVGGSGSSDDDSQLFPVAASTTITMGELVCVGADGFLISGIDTRGAKFVGQATETVDNSGGADGDLSCGVKRSGSVVMTSSGLTEADVGMPAWIGATATAVVTNPNNVFCGIISRYISATSCVVDIEDAANDVRVVNPDIELLPVAATTTITAGTLVCINASGYLIAGTTTAGISFAGMALETIDNSGGANGDLSCRVVRSGIFKFTAAGLAVTDWGADVWITNATTVTTTPGNVYAGKLSRYSAATVAHVDIGAAKTSKSRGEAFTLNFHYSGTVGNSLVKAAEDFELPYAFRILRGYVNAQVAPSSTYNCAIIITDGTTPKTITLVTTATKAEDEAINTVYAANTDFDVTLQDDNASATTAGVTVMYVCEWL